MIGLSCAEVCVCEEGGSEQEGEDTQSWGLTSQSESSEDEPDFFWLDASQAGHEEKAQRKETGKNRERKNPNLLAQKKGTRNVDHTNEAIGMYSDLMQRLM